MESSTKVPKLRSRWADPDSGDEKLNAQKVETPVKASEQLAPAAAEEIAESAPAAEPKPASLGVPPKTNGNGEAAGSPGMLDAGPLKSLPISRTQSPNPRTTLKWKGKNVIIQIPSDLPFGLPEQEGGRPMPLTTDQVEQRMQEWQEKGYAIEITGGDDGGQNKELFPEEYRGKVDASTVFVSIPDRRDWESYVTALQEEKLRALGVAADDPPLPASASFAGSYANSPAQMGNPFSPPPQPMSAMSNPMAGPNGYFNAFSPVSIPANGTPGPMGIPGMMATSAGMLPGHLAAHLPKQSMSMAGTPTGMNEWGEQYSVFTPPPAPQSQPTPPSMGGSGMWSPPTWNHMNPMMRNGSPAMPHGHSPSIWNGGYPQEPKMYDQWNPYNPLAAQERFHHEQMRRGSPLAHQGFIMEQPEHEVREDLENIDAPIPKHRHQLSLKAYDGSDNYNDRYGPQQSQLQLPEDGFATNPVSPAPVAFPSQPEIPRVESDVARGPEVASNPEEDVSEDEEKLRNQKDFQELEYRFEHQPQYPPPFPPQQQHIPHQQYPPRSREQSLSQMQNDFDAVDPVQNSAMQMLMAGEGTSGMPLRASIPEELLSEDGRTNISETQSPRRVPGGDEDELTNPSENELPPARKYSTISRSQGQRASQSSSHWAADHTKNTLSGTSSVSSKPKFNVAAKEFKFDPAAAATFTPGNPFIPASQKPPEDHTRDISVVSPQNTDFGSFGRGAYNASFRPNLVGTNSMDNVFAKSAAAFAQGSSPISPPPNGRPAIGQIFDGGAPDIIKPPTKKKIIPIVRPPSRPQTAKDEENQADEQRDMREGTTTDGGRKRAKRSPTLEAVKNTDVLPLDNMPEAAVKAAGEEDHSDSASFKSDPAEILAASRAQTGSIPPYEFKNQVDAAGFALAHPRDEKLVRQGTGINKRSEGGDELSPEQAALADVLNDELPRTPSPELSAAPARPPISEEKHKQFKKLAFNPTAKSFSFKPGQDFDFNFGTTTTATEATTATTTTPQPASRKFGGLGESRYAKSPSPPPSEPAPVPPVASNGSSFLPPRAQTPYESDPTKLDVLDDLPPRPMPTDAELDEVIKFMEKNDPVFSPPKEGSGESSDISDEDDSEPGMDMARLQATATWGRSSRKTSPRPGIPNFIESNRAEAPPRPGVQGYIDDTPLSQRQLQMLRSDGPSPSPRRVDLGQFERHRAASFSPDEEQSPIHAISGSYEPPNIGIAKDVDSDWDDMISDDQNPDGKLRPRSRLFFDSHVEELVGGLLKQRLDPVHKTLSAMREVLDTLSVHSAAIKGRFAAAEHSDADDEDDHSVTNMPARTSRDRKIELMRTAVTEALAMHSGTAVSEESLREIKEAIAANDSAKDISVMQQAVAETMAQVTRGEDMLFIRAALDDVVARVAHSSEIAELKNVMVDSLAGHAHVDDVAAVKEAVADVVSKVAQRVDLVDVKLALQDLDAKGVQRKDIDDVKRIVTTAMQSIARKEDLVPLHNVLAEAFEGTAKSQELSQFLNRLVDIVSSVVNNATSSSHQEIVRVAQIGENTRAAAAEVLRMTRDYSANMDFHQETHHEMIKDAQNLLATRSDNIQHSITEIQKFLQSRAAKGDNRKNQTEKENRENMQTLKNALADTMELIQHGFGELGRTHPTLDDFRSVVERLAGTQPGVQELKNAFEEAVKTLPGLVDFKAIVEEVVCSQAAQAPTAGVAGIEDFRRIIEQDRELKAEEFRRAVDKAVKSQPTIRDFEKLLEHAFAKNQLVVPFNMGEDKEEKENAEKLKARVHALENSLAQKEKEAADEVASKRSWEERAVESEKKLRMAEEQIAQQRTQSEDTERRLRSVDEKRNQALTQAQMRTALLEGAHQTLQKSVGDLSTRNASLDASLRATKASSDRINAENAELEAENRELRRQIDRVRAEMEESIKVRESFRGRFDNLQEGMRVAAAEVAQEQAKWRRATEESKARIDVLEARLAAEKTNTQGMQNEIRRLEKVEKEAIRARVEAEQYQRHNAKYEELVNQLRAEVATNHTRIGQLTQEVQTAQESASNEIARAQLEAQAFRDTLEKDVEKARSEIDRVMQDAAVEKEKMALMLEEANDQKTAALDAAYAEKETALREAADQQYTALEQQRGKYEEQLEEIRETTDRTLRIATEDAGREQYFLQERLSMAQEETTHLREHINTLNSQLTTINENFKIANVAAQAAAQAATTVREMSTPHWTDEKALRETVDVLQAQLQQREGRIDQLEQELAGLDKDKYKEAASHVTMYRELLDMRIDDLEEIIHSCGLAHPDLGSLRDAATRLRATLEMQRHEQERAAGIVASANATPGSSVASPAISAIATRASGVASAAWSNWRNRNVSKSHSSMPEDTPSRPSSAASGLLNGILTPPGNGASAAINARLGGRFTRSASEQPMSTASEAARKLPLLGGNPAIGRSGPQRPQPRLFRKSSYDADADSSVLDSGEFYDDEDTETERDPLVRRPESGMSKLSAKGKGAAGPYAS